MNSPRKTHGFGGMIQSTTEPIGQPLVIGSGAMLVILYIILYVYIYYRYIYRYIIWLVVWNVIFFSIHLGMSSSQLTHIFQRGRYTTNQMVSGGRWPDPIWARTTMEPSEPAPEFRDTMPAILPLFKNYVCSNSGALLSIYIHMFCRCVAITLGEGVLCSCFNG